MKTIPILILADDAGWLPVLPQRLADTDYDLAEVAAQETPDAPRENHSGILVSEAGFLPDAAAVIDAIRTHLPGVQGTGVGVVIGVASHRCYAAQVSTAGLPQRQLRQALPYRFETAVPFAVEDLVLDAHGHGDDRLVVATHAEPLQAFVHQLEDAGVRVHGIAPVVLLAAQSVGTNAGHTESSPSPNTMKITERPILGVGEPLSISEIDSLDGAVCAWRWLPGPAIEETADDESHTAAEETLRSAQATVQRVVAEDERLWINLQQGPLVSRHRLERIRRPLTATLAAAALFLVAVIGAMQVRAWQYRNTADRYDNQARTLYENAFPGEAVPVSMERRLKTRLRELRGRQGLASSDAQLFAEESTLAVLHDLLERLPADTRLIITDLRLSGDRIDLIGQARSHSDADTLAAALRVGHRFDVTPPSTENLPAQGVQFSLNLTPRPRNPRNPRSPRKSGDETAESLVPERVGMAAHRNPTDGENP